ncbi:DUF2805 domain-containing protein [Sulfitobacter albidus]|uniref:DUF2805 domain-containing protein n=1 Tax=Sulfitobacter albidus TaxID=2829501 RepID=A0A975PLH5_9RHOB|nr:DUF2805 domain-containing protein [Sulfitobacter albidus]QUJ75366.1 DUF2805 domain-containing protein [Sulfitobacter albidus]
MSSPAESLAPADVDAIVAMALSDHVPFDTIAAEYGLAEKDVKALMRATLKPASYRRWRARVRRFSDRREHYK